MIYFVALTDSGAWNVVRQFQVTEENNGVRTPIHRLNFSQTLWFVEKRTYVSVVFFSRYYRIPIQCPMAIFIAASVKRIKSFIAQIVLVLYEISMSWNTSARSDQRVYLGEYLVSGPRLGSLSCLQSLHWVAKLTEFHASHSVPSHPKFRKVF